MKSNSDPNIDLNKEKSTGEGVVGGAEPQITTIPFVNLPNSRLPNR